MVVKLYTKTGDTGETSLACGSRIPKDDLRIDSYGTIDELSSYLGVVCALIAKYEPMPHWTTTIEHLEWVQERLFTLSGMIATANLPSGTMPSLVDDDLACLEGHIDALEATVPELRHFILPGGGEAASFLHVARTVCRRGERLCTGLAREDKHLHPLILPFLNRLSDDLFISARWVTYQLGETEKIWLGRKAKRNDGPV